MLLFTILTVIIALLICIDHSNKKRRYELTEKIPGSRIYPIIGSILFLRRIKPEDVLVFFEKHLEMYGNMVKIWAFHKFLIFSTNPKDIEVVLSGPKFITKSNFYDFLKVWLGNGLILSDGLKWHQRRKIITPTFHFKILEQFVEIFDQQSAILVQKLRPHVDDKKPFNIFPYINLAALDVVAETAMGTKINAQTNTNFEYVRAVASISDILTKRFVSFWLRNDFLFSIFGSDLKKQQDQAVKVMHNFANAIIEERRSSLIKNQKLKEEPIDVDGIGSKKKMALLDLLLQAEVNGKPLTNDDIREEVDTFMSAGHDTTTAASCWALRLIAKHPEVQEKLFQEIIEVIGEDKSKPTTYRDLQDLKYMECVLKETLRLYPTVPVIGRYFEQDVDINGQIIPAGSNYNIPIYITQKNPDIFPNPEQFIPERHLFENSSETLNPYAFIPFSAGPRNCIGQKFAMLEMKSIISKILRHFELLPLGPEPKPILSLVLKSANGVYLGLQERVYC